MYSGDGQTSFEERACTEVVGVSRRDFLKRAVAALASAAGIAGGLGGLFSGCVQHNPEPAALYPGFDIFHHPVRAVIIFKCDFHAALTPVL